MKERVQLNLSVTLEQKLALQALAEGHGTTVTKLVLGLIEQGGVGSVPGPSSAAMTPGEPVAGSTVRDEINRTPSEGGDGPSADLRPPRVIESLADVPGALRRVASAEEARAFAPYSKQQQTGRGTPTRLRKAKAEPVASCRHGLLRCKVCGTG